MRTAIWALRLQGVLLIALLVAVGMLACSAARTHDALCSFRGDLERRADTNRQILVDHKGPVIRVYGLRIERGELEASLRNQELTLASLDDLHCEARK